MRPVTQREHREAAILEEVTEIQVRLARLELQRIAQALERISPPAARGGLGVDLAPMGEGGGWDEPA